MQIADDETFEADVIKPSDNLPVLVCFTTQWAGPATLALSNLNKIEPDYSKRATFVNVDVEDSPGTAEKYNVEQLPTFIVVTKGQVTDTWSGGDISQVQKKLDQHAPS